MAITIFPASTSGGTVTSVTSANADATVATTTTTPVITIVQAPALKSATTTVDVSAATAPSASQVLTATDSTHATWATPSAGNLTGPITSVGLATSIASQTGTGTKFVVDTSPQLVTPLLGTPTSGVLTNCTGLPEGGLSLTDITTNDSTTSKHGFLDKLPGGTTTFKRADGAWATPAGTVSSYLAQAFTAQTSVVVTHSFGAYPVVDIIDNTGAVIVPLSITHSSINAFTVVFTLSTTGTIMASVGSPQPATYVAISGTYAILAGDYYINATGGTFTATLPTAVGRAGQKFVIKNSGTGIVTIATTSSQTIDGQLTIVLAVQYQAIDVVSDGANWFVV